jgi:hypothetical protein
MEALLFRTVRGIFCERCFVQQGLNPLSINEKISMSVNKNSDTSTSESTASLETFLRCVNDWIRESLTDLSAIHVQVETAHGNVVIEWSAP